VFEEKNSSELIWLAPSRSAASITGRLIGAAYLDAHDVADP